MINHSHAIKSFRNALIVLILLIAVFSALVSFTDSVEELRKANIGFVLLAILTYFASVTLWIFSWAWLLNKKYQARVKETAFAGYASIFASLTPAQLGNDVLRSYLVKKSHSLPFSKTISLSMLLKGLKFLTLLIVSAFVISLLAAFVELSQAMYFLLLSGLIVVLAAVIIFLLPLSHEAALIMSSFIKKIPFRKAALGNVSDFILKYSSYVKINKKTFFLLVLVCIVSWLLEFLAFQLSFLSVGLVMKPEIFVLLFVVIAILERVPFTPRGIGPIEGAIYLVLSRFAPELSVQQIISFIIVFDFARIVFPVMVSLVLFPLWVKKFRKEEKTKTNSLPVQQAK